MNSDEIAEHTRQFLSKGGAVTRLAIRIGQNTGTRSRDECRTAIDQAVMVGIEKHQARVGKPANGAPLVLQGLVGTQTGH